MKKQVADKMYPSFLQYRTERNNIGYLSFDNTKASYTAQKKKPIQIYGHKFLVVVVVIVVVVVVVNGC